MARITVVIPVYHGYSTLIKCLQCLAQNDYHDFRVLVVDHGPGTSGEVDRVEYPEGLDLSVLRASSNLWWTGATNVGIRKALEEPVADYIMLLNDDCCLDKNAISTLVECADKNEKSIVTPVQVDASTGKILVRTAYTAYLLGFPTVIPPVIREKEQLPAVTRTGMIAGGRGVLIPGQTFRSVGLLNEKELPHYGADNDFYLRCKAAGYHLFVSNQAKVYVDSARTTTASSVASLTLRQFLATLTNRKSHRNIPDLLVHFRKHYPIPGLFPIGVILNLSRYVLIYILTRTVLLIRQTLS